MRAFWIRLALVWAALLSAIPAHAQAVQQSGAVTKFHAPAIFSNGWIGDGGGTDTPGINSLGLFNGTNCPFGISSQTGPGVSTQPYGLFTICQSPTATTLNISGVNGQATPSFTINVGGTSYPFPGPGTGTVTGPISSIVNDLACWNSTNGIVLKDCGTPAQAAANAFTIGLGNTISSKNLLPYTVAGITNFLTTGFYAAGDGGGAQYYVNSGSALPGDQVSADGVRLSLSLSQPLTWEQLGAPTTGWIGSGSISGTTFSATSTQNGTCCTVGMTLTAAGNTGAIAAGTKITAINGSILTVNIPQTVGSTVIVANDSQPYVAAANQLGIHGLTSVGPHWFSQATVVQGYPAKWSGQSSYGNSSNNFQATWYYPTGYSAIVAVPPNVTVNPQGDVTLTGSQGFGGTSGWSIDHVAFRVGDHNLPVSTVNNRPAVAVYVPGSLTDWQAWGADGDGLFVYGNLTPTLADKSHFARFVIGNAHSNGIETGGGDGNTIEFSNFIVTTVGASCIYENSFLGNVYDGLPQLQTCGQLNSVVRRSNNQYYSVIDNNVGNDPLTSPNAWALWRSSVGADTWSGGATYHVGVSIRTAGGANASAFIVPYTEGDAPPALLQAVSGSTYLTAIIPGQGLNPNLTNSSGYNSFGRAPTFTAYTNAVVSGVAYGFQTSGIASQAVGFFANNAAAPTTSTAGVFDVGTNGAPYARYKNRLSFIGSSAPAGVLGAWNNAGTLVDMLFWDSQNAIIGPAADNSFDLGSASFRYRNSSAVSYHPGAGTATWTSQSGTPEGSLTSTGGSFVTDTATGLGYLKTTVASGNTGYKQVVIAGAYTAAPLTMATSRLLGRTTASTGAAEEISVGPNLTLSGGSLTLTKPILSGTTPSIGGGALLAGACVSDVATVTGATTSMVASASPVTYPGDGNEWAAYVSAADTVTVKVCAIVAGTPTASAYNVRVLQ